MLSIGLIVLTQSKPLGMKMRCTWRPSGRSFLSHIFAPPNLRRDLSCPSSSCRRDAARLSYPSSRPRTVVMARCGARQRLKIFSIAAPSAGRVVAMRRDSGCAVEVRCFLWADGRPSRVLDPRGRVPTANSSAGTVFYALCCTLWWAPRARSRRAGKRRPEKPCLRVDRLGWCGTESGSRLRFFFFWSRRSQRIRRQASPDDSH